VPSITAATLRAQIASGETGPLYLLVGADDVERVAVAGEFAELVDEGLRAFNVERTYGGEVKIDRLIDSANTLPMMASRRVIIVLEGEKMLAPKRESQAADEEQERFEAFLQDLPRETTIVLVCAALDLRRKVVKLLLKLAQVVDCGSIEDGVAAEKWLRARAAREGVALEPAAVRALAERAGPDLTRLRAGIERVALYTVGRPVVTAQDVYESVPAGAMAPVDFGIANAVKDSDARGALRQLGAAFDQGEVAFKLLGQLRWVAETLPPPRIRAAIEAVFRTDLALKSSGGDPRVLMERLVVEMCGTAPPRTAPSGRAAPRRGAPGRR
jgi:DNA polymerase-3 subunit delta